MSALLEVQEAPASERWPRRDVCPRCGEDILLGKLHGGAGRPARLERAELVPPAYGPWFLGPGKFFAIGPDGFGRWLRPSLERRYTGEALHRKHRCAALGEPTPKEEQ